MLCKKNSIRFLWYFTFLHTLLINTNTNQISIEAPDALKNKVNIAYMIADLKYDGESLKILEFGNMTRSDLSPHERLYGKYNIWRKLFDGLHSHGLPVWFVGIGRMPCRKIKAFGAKCFKDLNLLEKDLFFRKSASNTAENYKGIVVIPSRRIDMIENFKAKHPGFVILNDITKIYGLNKHEACKLFDDEYLRDFKPEWKAYPKKYTPDLADRISNDFTSDIVVIKPIGSLQGRGVIIVEKANLDKTLHAIFTKTKKLKNIDDKSYEYWLKDKSKIFLVESFEESKIITVESKKYDATMRVVFSLTLANGEITLEFLGQYWKLPYKSLYESGTLTEHHKSKSSVRKSNPGGLTAPAMVDECDAIHVKEILSHVLPQLYIKMLLQNS